MKFTLFALAFTLLLAEVRPTTLVAAAPRKSADGVDLPTAAPERKFHPKTALVGTLLGLKPEEIGRIFNTKKSAALLAKRTTEDLGCDWFAINVEGADIAGFGLTEGRVSKAVLYYEVATPVKLAHLHKQIDGSADPAVKVNFRQVDHEKKHSLILMFEVEPIEFYLATNTVDPKIAQAMRDRRWVPEMTDDQALLIGDGPGKYLAIFADDTKSTGIGAGTVFADGGGPDIRVEIQAKNKQDAREQALKQHKKLKDLTKIGTAPEASKK